MDFTVILLVIVLIVILYLFYVYFIASTSKLVSSAYLMLSSTGVLIKDSPTVTNFSIGLWIFYNSWNTGNAKPIFTLANTNSLNSPFLTLSLADTAPVLTTKFQLFDGLNAPTSPVEIAITRNFPVQKWVYVIISVSNNVVDCYLDGRLITSYQLRTDQTMGLTNAPTLTMQLGSGIDAYVYNFVRYTYAMDPQTAQSTYYYGAPSMNTSSYNVSLELTKDGSEWKTYSLF